MKKSQMNLIQEGKRDGEMGRVRVETSADRGGFLRAWRSLIRNAGYTNCAIDDNFNWGQEVYSSPEFNMQMRFYAIHNGVVSDWIIKQMLSRKHITKEIKKSKERIARTPGTRNKVGHVREFFSVADATVQARQRLRYQPVSHSFATMKSL